MQWFACGHGAGGPGIPLRAAQWEKQGSGPRGSLRTWEPPVFPVTYALELGPRPLGLP